MKNILRIGVLTIGFLLLVSASTNAQELDWVVAGGGLGQDQGTAVTTDAHGDIYHAGDLGGRGTFGEGERNQMDVAGEFYVAKHARNGNLIWVTTMFSGGGDLNINGIDVDIYGNVYITGELILGDVIFGSGEANETTVNTGGNNTDVFVAKFDASGLFQWVRSAGISEISSSYDVAVDSFGSSYITGFHRSTIVFGADGAGAVVQLETQGGVFDADIFVAKYDTNGDLDWAISAGGSDAFDIGYGIDLDKKRNVYVTGRFSGRAVFGKNTKFETVVLSNGDADAFVARFDGNGALRWVVGIGGTGFDSGSDLATRNGKSAVVGTFSDTATFGTTSGPVVQRTAMGTDNIYVARYNRSGRVLWANDMYMDDNPNFFQDIGYGKYQESCVMSNYDGNATFGAGTADEVNLNTAGPSKFFACFSGNGTFKWAADDPATLNAGAVFAGSAITSKTEIITTGGFQNMTDFGPGDPNATTLTSDGGRDIFLAKYLYEKPQLDITLDVTSDRAGDERDALSVNQVPESFTLEGNYPNPFNPQTTIQFGLPEAAAVTVRVYDMTGRQVMELVNGTLEAGVHEVQLDASHLPSGSYLYRLSTPAGVQTKMMTLLK